MQKSLEQQLIEAIAHAMTARIEIDTTASAPDGSVTIVTSEKQASESYVVTRDFDGNLTCSCPARVVCKHVGICLLTGLEYHVDLLAEAQAAPREAFLRVDAWLASLEAPASEQSAASAALVLVERSERTLANVACSQEERLRALACLPVVIAAYAVVMGSAHVQQWYQAKEERWDRYQAARIGGCLDW